MPYHIDEQLLALDVPLPPDVMVTADLPDGPGGPGLAQVAGALRRLLGTGRVAAVGIACTWYAGNGAAAIVGPHLAAALRGS